jgi:hypothetical protein
VNDALLKSPLSSLYRLAVRLYCLWRYA